MRWSVVMPVYNEAALLPQTLGSLLLQSRAARIIVVDNGSSDGSAAIVGALAAGNDADVALLDEPRPGQVHALKCGIDAVTTDLVAICDADTVYPRDYLANAERLFDAGGGAVVAACAWPAAEESSTSLASRLSAAHRLAAMRLLPWQNHVNGGSQCFRTNALRAAGGYDPVRWPYVLKDHELMSRVLALGDQAASSGFFCTPSNRRTDRRGVRWTLAERLRYHLTPRSGQAAFFHNWLGPRFAARGKADTVLRERPWLAAEAAA